MSRANLFIRMVSQRFKFMNIAPLAVRGDQNRYHQSNRDWKSLGAGVTTTLLGAVLVGSTVKEQLDKRASQLTNDQQHNVEVPQNVSHSVFEAGQKRPDLPTYSAEEVSKHDNKSSFWVTYKHGVYDITSFLPSHPGGEQILNAAGLSIEPFWNVYGMHKTPQVFTLLETYRIGNLQDEDIVDHSDEELWVKEPVRDKRLIVKTAKPFNAEIPPESQIAHFDTPNELFYVRQHMPVPEVEAAHYRLTVRIRDASGERTHTYSLQDLRDQFQHTTVRAALMCAGNRRSEMDKVKPVKGISWGGGAVSNAEWGGVPLRDVLRACGLRGDAGHVIFQGSDIDATGAPFSTSVPLRAALRPAARVTLATHMNGAPLPRDHGAPLRAVVPGAPAVRSVKWLESITVSEEESPSHWHQKDYRSFNASTTWETADFPSAPPLYSLPVTSAICAPLDGDTVNVVDGYIEVQGYAYSGGGAAIVRVDISPDGGASWLQADIVHADDAPPGEHYSWTLWAVKVPVQPGQTEVELWAKATDSNFNTQPETFEHIWNIRGILSNAYHRIKVKLEH